MRGLQEVIDLLHGDGMPMLGAKVDQEEAVRIVRRRFPYSEYCLIRDWIWIDLDVSATVRTELARTQRQPAVIYAHTVIYDSARRWDCGDFVRTSPLYKFEDGFIFLTLATAYILMGDGIRKRAAPETVWSIF